MRKDNEGLVWYHVSDIRAALNAENEMSIHDNLDCIIKLVGPSNGYYTYDSYWIYDLVSAANRCYWDEVARIATTARGEI